MNVKEITAKVEKGLPLTKEEEKTYMMKVLGYTEKEVNRIFKIVDNKDPNVLID